MTKALNLPGVQTLDNFFESVQYQNPALAYLIRSDLTAIILGGIKGDRLPAYDAVRRTRVRVDMLPIALTQILDEGLKDLGYSLEHIYKEPR